MHIIYKEMISEKNIKWPLHNNGITDIFRLHELLSFQLSNVY